MVPELSSFGHSGHSPVPCTSAASTEAHGKSCAALSFVTHLFWEHAAGERHRHGVAFREQVCSVHLTRVSNFLDAAAMGATMDEANVKALVLSRVREASGRRKKPVVASEFSLGSSGVRADLAIFAETTIGVEIKTARDTLRRLSSQMAAYSRYFDHSIAVVAPCHVRNLTDDHLQGSSLWTYDDEGMLRVLHTGSRNVVEPSALLDVLTQAERRLVEFDTAMQRRYGETSATFWRSVTRRAIRPQDLALLSRFVGAREQAKRAAAERESRWSQWLTAQGDFVSASA